jgi:hypothetical protein
VIGDHRIELMEHDLAAPPPALRRFDAAVSPFAIHRIGDERKRSLYREVFDLLEICGSVREFEACGAVNLSPTSGVASIWEPIG